MDISKLHHLVPQNSVLGDQIHLKTSSKSHWPDVQVEKMDEHTSVNFANILNSAFQKVNDQQVEAEALATKMVSEPNSVQLHDVLIAGEKARMAITFTKTMTDLAVRTYRELTNLR